VPVTGYGRHAAGKPPSLALPLLGLTLLIALAAGGWLLFASSGGERDLALAGDNAKLPPPVSAPPAPTAAAVPATAPKAAAPHADTVAPVRSVTAGSPLLPLPKLLPKTAIALAALTGPVARLNWQAMAACESHNNPRAVNAAGYYGLYQFSRAAWTAVGGMGLPHRASAAEQTLRAQLLYRRAGGRWQAQWPACGSRLFTP
jgi:hypothetical protein